MMQELKFSKSMAPMYVLNQEREISRNRAIRTFM